jgi:hypothetical protein
MADLKFPDYEKEFIAKNRVDTTYHSNRQPEVVFLMPSFLDTVLGVAYDSVGNKVFSESGSRWWTNYTNWEYDSTGFVRKKTSHSCMDYISYIKYNLENNTLTEKVYDVKRDNTIDSATTAIYTFDIAGRLCSSNTVISDVDYRTRFNNTYVFNDSGLLVEVKGEDVKRRWRKKANNYSKKIYYTNNIPDSAIFRYIDYEAPKVITIKTYYDNRGLKYKEIKNDTLVIWYKHHIRK